MFFTTSDYEQEMKKADEKNTQSFTRILLNLPKLFDMKIIQVYLSWFWLSNYAKKWPKLSFIELVASAWIWRAPFWLSITGTVNIFDFPTPSKLLVVDTKFVVTLERVSRLWYPHLTTTDQSERGLTYRWRERNRQPQVRIKRKKKLKNFNKKRALSFRISDKLGGYL